MTEKKGDTIVFTFGRFNPPTIGHEILIKAVESVARAKGGDYLIFPSHTQDAKKNPLTQTEKIKYMKKMFSGYRRNIVKSTGKDALEIAGELHKKKYTNLVMVVGSDRVKNFQTILDRYNGEDNKHGFYDFDKIEVISAGERDPDSEGAEGMSASKMREAAIKGDFQTFRSGIPSSLSDDDTKKMLNDIRKAMRLDVLKEGSKWKNIDFNIKKPDPFKILTEDKQISFQGFTTKYLHTSPEGFELFDEMINTMSGFSSKEHLYIKESLKTLDEYLCIKQDWEKVGKINQQDLFHMEQLASTYNKIMSNLDIDHLDNSFIYKYISRVRETLEWGDTSSLLVYKKDTPGQDVEIDEGKVSEFIRKKLKISKQLADKMVHRAVDLGIDLQLLQQKWAVVAPSLTALVSEYRPQENENVTKNR
jgi:hypothetical protein|tara:strand:- start:832 stop:2088 length:1257 start_codon:yes stop_codon:yes gene_type:complete